MEGTPKERLEALGYIITKKGRLVRKSCTSKGFIFTTQEEYDKISAALNDEIQRRMKEELGLEEHWLPDQRYEGTGCNVFATPKILESTAPLLVLICGKGPIYAGLWAPSLSINDDLDTGSMLPDIRRAQSLGWSVLVMNPNKRLIDPASMKKKEGESEDEEEEDEIFYYGEDGETEVFDPFYDDNEFFRAEFAWRKFVVPSKAQSILVMGHSYAGSVVTSLFELDGVAAKILPRVGAIALADSSHDSLPHGEEARKMFLADQDVVCNWVRSPTNPLDTPEVSYDGVKCVSAGHKKHVYTLFSARESMWKFLIDRSSLSVRTKPTPVPKMDSESGSKSESDSKSDSKSQPKSNSKPNSKSQGKPKQKTQQKSQTKVKLQIRPQQKVQSQQKSQQNKPKPKAKTQPKVQPNAKQQKKPKKK